MTFPSVPPHAAGYGPGVGYPAPPAAPPGWPGWGHPAHEPVFRVRVITHTGLVLAWQQSTRTVTGTYRQCLAAIADAQRHNLTAGWLSPASLLLFNWIALAANATARRTLAEQANAVNAPGAPGPRGAAAAG